MNGVAMFSCSADGFWKVIEPPVCVSSQVVVEPGPPRARQLESVLDEYERFEMVVADSQRARVFLFELGEVVERTELFTTIEEVAPALASAAEVAFRLFRRNPSTISSSGRRPEVAAELAACLHPYLRGRLVERLSLSVAGDRRAAPLSASTSTSARSGARGASPRAQNCAMRSGLAVVVSRGSIRISCGRFVERRVEHLLVSAAAPPEFPAPPSLLGFLAKVGRRCGPAVAASRWWTRPPTRRPSTAIEQRGDAIVSCRVWRSADLDDARRIGAPPATDQPLLAGVDIGGAKCASASASGVDGTVPVEERLPTPAVQANLHRHRGHCHRGARR